MYDNYTLGLEAISLFFSKNKETDESYHTMVSWKQIFNILQGHKPMKELPVIPEKPWFCFVADGGFEKWTGRDILTKGVGGSETFIIEMAKYMQKNGKYNVIVFCKCNEEDNFDGVIYRNLTEFSRFISENIVEHCMVSRYTEYIPLCIRSHVQNLYLILHDLLLPETIIPINPKLKHIFCLTDWHAQYFLSYFPIFKDITKTFSYGIDQSKFIECKKKKHKFIYSSYPNRGLLYLLKVWPRIVSKYPEATLHIYCDVESNWANSMYRDHMIEVKRLLYNFMSVESLNIKYHGWVDKNTLSESWRTADVWFYPCTYAETFCLTALEAAMSKTLVVTNDLAALINTVGDRGEVIKGDPSTEDWQDRALEKLFDVLESPIKNELIERNYNWAMQLSWESRANELIEYLR
jgi:glycosyltransferase involved in cell wall biosynthesis